MAIFAHLKYTHLANWGRGGLRGRKKDSLAAAVAAGERADQEVLWLWKGGGSLGLFSGGGPIVS